MLDISYSSNIQSPSFLQMTVTEMGKSMSLLLTSYCSIHHSPSTKKKFSPLCQGTGTFTQCFSLPWDRYWLSFFTLCIYMSSRVFVCLSKLGFFCFNKDMTIGGNQKKQGHPSLLKKGIEWERILSLLENILEYALKFKQ